MKVTEMEMVGCFRYVNDGTVSWLAVYRSEAGDEFTVRFPFDPRKSGVALEAR